MRTRKTSKTTPASKRPAAKKRDTSKANKDADLPGYPKYSAGEDITRRAKRVDENLDDEVLTQVKHSKEPRVSPNEDDASTPDVEGESPDDNFNVTNEDLEALGPKDLSMDMGEDEQLKHRTRPVDFAGNDLDVPGAELDDEQEKNGSEDEENNSYSLGADKEG